MTADVDDVGWELELTQGPPDLSTAMEFIFFASSSAVVILTIGAAEGVCDSSSVGLVAMRR